MIDLRLEYQGKGVFHAAFKLDYDVANDNFEQGERLRAQLTRRRSVRQNNLLHALIQAAYDNQRGGIKLASWEHLKAHLLIRVGWCEEIRIKHGAITKEAVEILKRRFDYCESSFSKKTREIIMRFAKSVSFDPKKGATPDDMVGIMDGVIAIICTEIVPGMDPESIMNMAKERA